MNRLILFAASAAIFSTMAWGAPNCVTATYTSYIGLGAGGCQLGDALFSNFSSLSFVNIGVPTVSSDNVNVIPGGGTFTPMLTFVYASPITVNQSGQQFAMGLSYQVTLGTSTLASAQIASNFGNSSPGSASATKDAQLLSGGSIFTSTVNDQGSSNALSDHAGNIVFTSGTGTWVIHDAVSLQAQTGGSVTQTNFQNNLTLTQPTNTPETATILMIGSGLSALSLLARRRRQHPTLAA